MYRCFFIGHREAPENIYPELAQTMEQLIEQGVTDFYVGHYGNFDHLAARGGDRSQTAAPRGAIDHALAVPPSRAGSDFAFWF